MLEDECQAVAAWSPVPETRWEPFFRERKVPIPSKESRASGGKGANSPFPPDPLSRSLLLLASGSALTTGSAHNTPLGQQNDGKNWLLTKFLIGTGILGMASKVLC